MPCSTIEIIAKDVEAIFDMAVCTIDSKFGEGYARVNPNLLSTVVTTATDVYVTNLSK